MNWFGFKLPKQKTWMFVLGVAILLFVVLFLKRRVFEGFQSFSGYVPTPSCPSGYTLYTTTVGGVSVDKCQSTASSIAWGGGGGNPAANITAIPPTCRGLGTAQPRGAFQNMMLYSPDECKALGGTWSDDTNAATDLGGSTRVGQCIGGDGGYTWNCRGLSANPKVATTCTDPNSTPYGKACKCNTGFTYGMYDAQNNVKKCMVSCVFPAVADYNKTRCVCSSGYSNTNTGQDSIYNPTCKPIVQCPGSAGLMYTDLTGTACKCAANSFPSMIDPAPPRAILGCIQCPTDSKLSSDGTTCICIDQTKGFSIKQNACVSCPSMYTLDSTKTKCNGACCLSTNSPSTPAQDTSYSLVCDSNADSTNGGVLIKDQGGKYSGYPLGNTGNSFICCPTYTGCANPTISGGNCVYTKFDWKSICSPKTGKYAPKKYPSSSLIS